MCVSKENAELLEGDLGEKKRGGMQEDSRCVPCFKKAFQQR